MREVPPAAADAEQHARGLGAHSPEIPQDVLHVALALLKGVNVGLQGAALVLTDWIVNGELFNESRLMTHRRIKKH